MLTGVQSQLHTFLATHGPVMQINSAGAWLRTAVVLCCKAEALLRTFEAEACKHVKLSVHR